MEKKRSISRCFMFCQPFWLGVSHLQEKQPSKNGMNKGIQRHPTASNGIARSGAFAEISHLVLF
jgi:hypothetical protein